MAIDIKKKRTYLIFDSPTVQAYIEGERKRGLNKWDFNFLLLKNPPNNRRRTEIWQSYMDKMKLEDIRKEVGIENPINSRATLHRNYLIEDPDTGEINRILDRNISEDIVKAAIQRLLTLRYEPACSNGLISFIGLDKHLLSYDRDNEILNSLLDRLAEELLYRYRIIVNVWLIVKLDEITTTLIHYLHSTTFNMKWKAAMLTITKEKARERVNILTVGLLTLKNPNKNRKKDRKIFKKYLKKLEEPKLYEPLISLEKIREEIPNCQRIIKSKKFNKWFEKESGLLIPFDKPVVVFGSIFDHGLNEIPKEDWRDHSKREILQDVKKIEKEVLGGKAQ
jgi:hypothetical protein